MYTFTIEENLLIKIFKDGETNPLYISNKYPRGDHFSSLLEAQTWAELFIEWLSDSAAPFAPNSRGEAGESRESWKLRSGLDR